MKKKTKPAVSQEDIFSAMFPSLPTSDDVKVEEPVEGTEGAPRNDAVSKLQEEIKNLRGQVSNMESERLNLLAMAPPAPPPIAPVTGQQPDRVAEPDKYAEWLINKKEREFQHQQAVAGHRQQQVAVQQQKIAALWTDFNSAHPDYAERADRVEIAAQRAMAKAQQKGLDLDKYMFGASSTFLRDVTKTYDELFDKPGDGEGEGSGEDDDALDQRTAGISGGTTSGGKPSGVARTALNDLGSLTADVKSWQEKHGYTP